MSLDISRTADLMVIAIARALVKGESVFPDLPPRSRTSRSRSPIAGCRKN